MLSSHARIIKDIYERLYRSFGPQDWWPGDTRFEIITGAILTQNTNWGNVEKALNNLKEEKLLSPEALKRVSPKKLASLIRPAGYFNVKARRLKNFISFLYQEYGGSLSKMANASLSGLRRQLLAVNGIGPETADSILLYAFDKPVFVVDAYTKRVFSRHRLIEEDSDYHGIQEMFMGNIKEHVPTFNEYHALIVRLAKDFCKTKAQCGRCPLNRPEYYLINEH